jgi:prepilin-type N-terminal cleavage/methylation domain-containing protein
MRSAFSLVELSIVLVILGLLVGGVLTGQNLIRASELRAVSTEFNQYQTAILAFRDKYMALPGDMSNATDFWGGMSDCTNGSASGTCNGNGNSMLSKIEAASQVTETFLFWQHLALAGMIEGQYSGVSGAGNVNGNDGDPGINIPGSKLGNAAWATNDLYDYEGSTTVYEMNYGGSLQIGGVDPDKDPYLPILTPTEAWGVDKKIDDGLPAKGKVVARYYNNACSVADDGTSSRSNLEASYKLSDDTLQCMLYFRDVF